MKKIFTLSVLFLLFISAANAQKADGTIKGKLMDTATKLPISEATVSLIDTKDSSIVTYTLTNKLGVFEISNLLEGSYQLVISHMSIEPIKKNITISATSKSTDLGTVIAQTGIKTLDGVVVTNEAPITIKGDTVQFRADAFKTKPNPTVEDLLKKIPGMEVSKDGSIKSQGEAVQRVFFLSQRD